MRRKAKTPEQSEGFKSLVAYANDTPDLLSLLYDLGRMPEQVDDKPRRSTRQEMLAVIFGFKTALALQEWRKKDDVRGPDHDCS